jgi:hypothetical protein
MRPGRNPRSGRANVNDTPEEWPEQTAGTSAIGTAPVDDLRFFQNTAA